MNYIRIIECLRLCFQYPNCLKSCDFVEMFPFVEVVSPPHEDVFFKPQAFVPMDIVNDFQSIMAPIMLPIMQSIDDPLTY